MRDACNSNLTSLTAERVVRSTAFGNGNSASRPGRGPIWPYFLFLLFVTTLAWGAPQDAAPTKDHATGEAKQDWAAELDNYPGLMEEFGRLVTKMQHDIQLPAARSQSRLLQVLPQSTVAYGAFPNYGEAVRRALKIFHDEQKDNAALRVWWQHAQASSKDADLEFVLQKYCDLSDYLGDEIVVAGSMQGKEGGLLVVAEVKKPGLEEFLRGAAKVLAGKSTPPRILNPKQLAAATGKGVQNQSVILVRPGLVVFGSDLSTIREFSTQLDSGQGTLATTPFGRRLAESYANGVGILAAADLEKILSQTPIGVATEGRSWERSGFADVKYAVWEYKDVSGQAASQAELSFIGPRHGVASWLASPAPLGSLDFISPKAAMAMAVLLKNPADIFSDIKELSGPPKAQAADALTNLEPVLTPILSQLTGEIGLELDAVPPAAFEWKAILRVKDANALQLALSPMLAAFQPRQIEQDGVTFNLLSIPNSTKPVEISYSFQDGYLLIGSSQEAVAGAVRIHQSGESLAKSEKFHAALPPGHSADASGIMYQNSSAYMAMMFAKMPPELSRQWSQVPEQNASVVSALYGEESAIREASKSGAAGVAPVLIVAAIAIPNLLRSRIAANEASAVGRMRSVVTAQVTYASMYPDRGFARDLASLGGGGSDQGAPTPKRSLLLDSVLGCPEGTAEKWCTWSGYKFTLSATCKQSCTEFVTLGTPVSTNSGLRSFCSTSDGVIRVNTVGPLTAPISAKECVSWEALK